MVVRRSLTLGLSGVAIGLAGSLVVTRAMQSLLYGVSPVDPLSLVLVGATLALAAVAASLPTAWRASRVNPTETLRAE
jgi:ABC-type antimicrobial peptide transport system permease subunit